MKPEDIEALRAARHPDPFAVLGMHADERGLWVRVMLPGAVAVAVRDTLTGRRIAALQPVHADGLFEGRMPRRRRPFDYRLQVTWASGHEGLYGDPYQVGPLLSAAELQALADGTHRRPFELLGAHPIPLGEGPYRLDGVRFAVWAPNARRVGVVGDFNAWDGRRHPMRARGASGVWELFVPQLALGSAYQFEIVGADGALLPRKADPWARAAQLRPGRASLVAPPLPPPRTLPPGRAAANQRRAPISIYEVHAGSWRRAAGGGFLDWDALAATLPAHAADLGFTHLELLPITEHPFDGSWGYQTLGLFAPTARFGDGAGFARFVAACHAQGLGLLLDWVPAHFPADEHGLARFDGTPLYEYADPREGFHRDWNTLIPNFGRREVAGFLAASALYWVERFGVDGLRVDAVASMLYRDYSRPPGEWLPNVHGGHENLEAIALLQRVNTLLGAECPGAITVAEESTAFPGVSAPVHTGGLGFHFKWNMGWMNDTLRYLAEDPVHRRWHHDKIRFGLSYAFSENFVLPLSHDEVVHGKGTILGRMPGDDWQQFANLRACYGLMWAHPGKKLLFMGQEWGQRSEWNHEVALPWADLDDARHAGVLRLVRELNRLYRELPALHARDCEAEGFEWVEADDAERSVFAWLRHDGRGGALLMVANLTPVPRAGYVLGVPRAGRWQERLNTDAAGYGGSGAGNAAGVASTASPAHGHPQSLRLTLPPLAVIYLTPA